MAKLSEKALRKRDAARDIGAELLASVREMKAGKAASDKAMAMTAGTDRERRWSLSLRVYSRTVGNLPLPLA